MIEKKVRRRKRGRKEESKGEHKGELISLDAGGISDAAPPEAHLRIDDIALLRALGNLSADCEIVTIDSLENLKRILLESEGALPRMILCSSEEFGDETKAQLSASLLEAAGFQVWVSQWHPKAAAEADFSWFRIFPYPSLPFSNMLPTSLMAFRTPLTYASVEKAVNRVLRRS